MRISIGSHVMAATEYNSAYHRDMRYNELSPKCLRVGVVVSRILVLRYLRKDHLDLSQEMV